MAHNRLRIEGMRFGRLTVLADVGTEGQSDGGLRSVWLCQCDCGNSAHVVGNSLACGNTKSCGCLASDITADRNRTHGMSSTREYRIWQAMLNRCRNKSMKQYKNYGGRGIKVCERWNRFENFYADMGACPIGLSIERKNVDGDYEPSNCIWADRVTQCRNKRTNRLLTFNGITKCLIEWAIDLGIDQASLRERLKKWTLEKALTTPKKGR